jgi:hypothetical protein
MLSEELRNLALWINTRRHPVEVHVVVCVLEELAEQAERMEAGTRLMSGVEVAERIALEAYGPRSR